MHTALKLAGQEGLEPPTTGLEIRCSIQLSYCPKQFINNYLRLIRCILKLALVTCFCHLLQNCNLCVHRLMKKVAECLYLNESSGTYYALVKRSGKQIRRSLKTQDRKLAERRLADFRREVGNLSTRMEDRRLRFEALANRWLKIANAGLKQSSASRNDLCVKNLERTFGGLEVSRIGRQQCEDWLTARRSKVSARTTNYDLQVLKRIFVYGLENGILLLDPTSSIKPLKETPKRPLVPTLEQFDLLIATLSQMAQRDSRVFRALHLIQLLAYSGMRKGEATSIVWGDIDLAKNVFAVTGGESGTKNRRVRIVPLFPRLSHFLDELRGAIEMDDGTSGSVKEKQSKLAAFIAENPRLKIAQINSARKALSSATVKAGLPHFDHHCMRHFFISNAIEKGIDFKTIGSWVGHQDGGLLVAKTYGHLRDTHSHEMAKRMS